MCMLVGWPGAWFPSSRNLAKNGAVVVGLARGRPQTVVASRKEFDRREKKGGRRGEREREGKKLFWSVRVFETRIYTVLDFLEKFHFLLVLSHDFDF